MDIIPNLHPIFVHYTVALLSISSILFILSFFFPNSKYKEQFITVARWNLWIGSFITIITLAAGFLAYNTVEHNAVSHAAMTNHRNWAIPTSALFFILAFWQAKVRLQKRVNFIFVLCIACASLLLIITAHEGGELVYRHGMGVMPLPGKIESLERSHKNEKAHELSEQEIRSVDSMSHNDGHHH